MPMVVAIDTQINIKTLSNHRVSVTVREAENFRSNLGSFHKDTGEGDLTITTSVSVDKIDLVLQLKKDGVNILSEKATNISVGFPVYINLIPGEFSWSDENPNVEPEVNETEETNETEVEEEVVEEEPEISEEEIEEEKESGKITGFVVDGTKNIVTSKITYYTIGAIFGLAILFFIVVYSKKKLKNKKGSYIDFKVKDDDKEKSVKNAELEDAEKKLNEAKRELDDIKNRKSKLQEAKENFEKAKKELDKAEKED
tara:strand:- start:5317 stop:6084 length:768 start_codon:yes stop_codon:yes gene_type:complete